MKFYSLIFALSVAALVAAIDSCSEAVIKNVIKFLFFIVNKLQAQSAALHTVQVGTSSMSFGKQRQFLSMGFSVHCFSASLRFLTCHTLKNI